MAEALKAGTPVSKIVIARDLRPAAILEEITKLADKANVPIELRDKREVESLAHGRVHQGTIAMVGRFSYVELSQLLAPEEVRLVLLDGITDPANLGSILRSAEAFGWTGILIPKHRSVQVTATVRKVSAGASERMPVARVGSAADAIRTMASSSVVTFGLDPAGGDSYFGIEWPKRVCLVLGAEGKGLSRLVRDRCDRIVRIPVSASMSSVNVAVAAAVVMVEVTRSRGLDNR